jgi:hypothetical protein
MRGRRDVRKAVERALLALCLLVAVGVLVVGAPSPTSAASAASAAAPAEPSCCDDQLIGSAYHGIGPVRILDTRTTIGGWNGSLNAGQPRTLRIAGVGNIPASAHAAALNVTVTGATAGSFITVYPEGTDQPETSDINFAGGETIPNAVTVGIGDNGGIAVANAIGSVDVVIDLVGWYSQTGADGDSFFATPPTRLLDSRTTTGAWSGPLPAGEGSVRPLHVVGGSIPATATNVVLTVTATASTAASFLSVWPAGGTRPNASSLNFAAGQTIANSVTVPVGAGGDISFFNAVGAVHVVVDVAGYFDPAVGGRLHVLQPQRLIDSRLPLGVSGAWTAGQTQQVPTLPSVPGSASAQRTAWVLNVTATNATAGSFLSPFAYGGPPITSSFLNFGRGQTIATRTVLSLEPSGFVGITNQLGTVDLVGDLSGYYVVDLPVRLGSPTNGFGNQVNATTNPDPPTCAQHQAMSTPPCGVQPMVWAAVDGPLAVRDGDPYSTRCLGAVAPDCALNPSYRAAGYDFAVDVSAADVAKPLTLSVYDASTSPRTFGAGSTFDCDANAAPFDQAPYTTGPGVFAAGFGARNCQTGDSGTPQNLDLQLYAAHRAAPPSTSAPIAGCHLLVAASDAVVERKNRWQTVCEFEPTEVGRYVLRVRNSGLPGLDDTGNGTNAFALRVDGGSTTTVGPLQDASVLHTTTSASTRMYLAEVKPDRRGMNLDVDIFGLGGEGLDPATIQVLGPSAGAPAPSPTSGTVVPAAGVASLCSYNAVASPTLGPATPDTAIGCQVTTGSGADAGRYRDGWLRIRVHLAPTYNCGFGATPDCWWTLRTTNGATFTADRFTWSVHLAPP